MCDHPVLSKSGSAAESAHVVFASLFLACNYRGRISLSNPCYVWISSGETRYLIRSGELSDYRLESRPARSHNARTYEKLTEQTMPDGRSCFHLLNTPLLAAGAAYLPASRP